MSDSKSNKSKMFRHILIAGIIILGVLSFNNFMQLKALNINVVSLNNMITGRVVENNAEQPTVKPTSGTKGIDMLKLMDDDSIKGDLSAPVTIVEFSDFECPYCARFYDQTLPSLLSEYVETGKVKIIFRDFPLGFHSNAQKAAEAAECAGEQGKYWDMHDKLFEDGVTGGVSSFKQYAKDLSLNTATFDSCLDNGDMADEVKQDMVDGAAAGVTGTPGFIIDGELVSGAQPFANFKAIIDAKLAANN